MKKLLGLVYDEKKRIQIKELCREKSFEFVEISETDLSCTLGSLVGLPIPSGEDNPEVPKLFFAPELIIFSGFLDSDLEEFLDSYKARGISPIGLKGSVTPFNINWSLYKLILEYQEESKKINE